MTHALRRALRHQLAALTVAAMCLGAAAGGPATAVEAPEPAAPAQRAAGATVDPQADLLAKEAQYVSDAYNLGLRRFAEYHPPRVGARFPTYDINTRVTRGTEVVYERLWHCRVKYFDGCNNYDQRRGEYFAAALAKHRQLRTQLLAELDADYLSRKNDLNVYRGKPFFLVNNLTTRTESGGSAEGLSCLDVEGDPGTAPGSRVQLMDCQIDRAASVTRPTDQVWRFVPGTGMVKNVASGLCLDVVGLAEEQVEHSNVVLADCDIGSPQNEDQTWGMHPLGYLVNLATWRCLDLTGNNQAPADGLGASVATCEYGLSGALDSLGSSSRGLTPADPRTDQSWSLWFVDGGMDDLLPAPAPPNVPEPPTDTTPPSVTITSAGQRRGAMSAGVAFSMDDAAAVECRVDAGPFVPCTSPYETPRLSIGDHQVTVNAADAAGNFTEVDATVTVEFDESVRLMFVEEVQVNKVHDLVVQRTSRVTRDRTNTRYEITASATDGTGYDGTGFAYQVHWECSRSGWQPNKCNNFEDRRTEFFTKALKAHRAERAERAGFVDLDYLSRKNELGIYQGAPFLLFNNQHDLCLDVRERPRLGDLQLLLSACKFGSAEAPSPPSTNQVWRFLPGPGQVQNVLSGQCLDVAGPAAQQAEGNEIVLAPCPQDIDAAEFSDFRWGMHPFGYLVNLASGRCLDMGVGDATKNIVSPPRVVTCQYGYGPVPSGRGSSRGLTAEDAGTNQSWSMSYVNGGMDDLLPAPPPPFDPTP